MNQSELNSILSAHENYAFFKRQEGINAYFANEDLSGLSFSKACLTEAVFNNCNLQHARMGEIVASKAVFNRCNFYGAQLNASVFESTRFHYCDFSAAQFSYADLSATKIDNCIAYSTNFSNASFRNAELNYSNFPFADFTAADLESAEVNFCNWSEAKFVYAQNIPKVLAAQLTRCPPAGSFIGYKKLGNGTIAKLLIPEDAERSSSTGFKCRASYAIVLEGDGTSIHDITFVYKTGEKVIPSGFDKDRWQECAPGIHFYLTREEAEAY